MKSAPIRYGTRFGCRFGQPHDFIQIHDSPTLVAERCIICNKVFRWKKGYKKRIKNVEYLQAHVRRFAQRGGSTQRAYHKIHDSVEKQTINL